VCDLGSRNGTFVNGALIGGRRETSSPQEETVAGSSVPIRPLIGPTILLPATLGTTAVVGLIAAAGFLISRGNQAAGCRVARGVAVLALAVLVVVGGVAAILEGAPVSTFDLSWRGPWFVMVRRPSLRQESAVADVLDDAPAVRAAGSGAT